MNLKEIQKLIASVKDSGANELKLDFNDVKMVVKVKIEEKKSKIGQFPKAYSTAIPLQIIATTQQMQKPIYIKEENDFNRYIIKSPFIGTFEKRQNSEKSKCLEVGDMIKEGDLLGTIESLKLLNELSSEFSGKIVEILVNDSTPVEFDQSLFVIVE